MKRNSDIYGGRDPLELPAYSLPRAARLVHVNPATLRSWVVGRDYHTKGSGKRRAHGLIHPPGGGQGFLSFVNLVEAHVLSCMRKEHKIEMYKCRTAIQFVEQKLGMPHPLARESFRTDGAELFVERFGKLINVSSDGQLALRAAIAEGLKRVGYHQGMAARLFPYLRPQGDAEQPKFVVIDPRIAFGRPVLDGTGIPVEEIVQRFQAGDSSDHLANEFGVGRDRIEEAVRLTILEAA